MPYQIYQISAILFFFRFASASNLDWRWSMDTKYNQMIWSESWIRWYRTSRNKPNQTICSVLEYTITLFWEISVLRRARMLNAIDMEMEINMASHFYTTIFCIHKVSWCNLCDTDRVDILYKQRYTRTMHISPNTRVTQSHTHIQKWESGKCVSVLLMLCGVDECVRCCVRDAKSTPAMCTK